MPPKPSKTIDRAYVLASRNSDRSKLYALKADKAKRTGLAKLFRASVDSRQVQINRARMLLRGKIAPSFEDNLADHAVESAAVVAELAELIEQARQEGAGGIAKALDQMRRVEMAAQAAYQKALKLDDSEESAPYQVCQICGYVAQGQVPEECPVCGAIPEKFKQVD